MRLFGHCGLLWDDRPALLLCAKHNVGAFAGGYAGAMAEPFKLLLNAPLVAHAAGHFSRVSPGFDAEAFTATATAGLDTLN